MANGTRTDDAERCEGIQMTVMQCNAVIEDKLTHLQPVMECTLVEMQRLHEGLSNGEIDWRALLEQAIKNHKESA